MNIRRFLKNKELKFILIFLCIIFLSVDTSYTVYSHFRNGVTSLLSPTLATYPICRVIHMPDGKYDIEIYDVPAETDDVSGHEPATTRGISFRERWILKNISYAAGQMLAFYAKDPDMRDPSYVLHPILNKYLEESGSVRGQHGINYGVESVKKIEYPGAAAALHIEVSGEGGSSYRIKVFQHDKRVLEARGINISTEGGLEIAAVYEEIVPFKDGSQAGVGAVDFTGRRHRRMPARTGSFVENISVPGKGYGKTTGQRNPTQLSPGTLSTAPSTPLFEMVLGNRKRILREYENIVKGGKVLDIGTGAAGHFALWAESSGASEVVSIDVSNDVVLSARRMVEEKGSSIKIERKDAAVMDFPEESFDAVIAAFFPWESMPGEAVAEIIKGSYEVLSRDGDILLIVNNDNAYHEKDDGMPGVLEDPFKESGIRPWSHSKWKKVLSDTGFGNVRTQYIWEQEAEKKVSRMSVIIGEKVGDGVPGPFFNKFPLPASHMSFRGILERIEEIYERVISPIRDMWVRILTSAGYFEKEDEEEMKWEDLVRMGFSFEKGIAPAREGVQLVQVDLYRDESYGEKRHKGMALYEVFPEFKVINISYFFPNFPKFEKPGPGRAFLRQMLKEYPGYRVIGTVSDVFRKSFLKMDGRFGKPSYQPLSTNPESEALLADLPQGEKLRLLLEEVSSRNRYQGKPVSEHARDSLIEDIEASKVLGVVPGMSSPTGGIGFDVLSNVPLKELLDASVKMSPGVENSQSFKEMLLCIDAVVAAADKLEEFTVSQRDLGVETKPDKTYVTAADELLNDFLTKTLSVMGRPVVAEESDNKVESVLAGNYIAVDPIDGTSGFIKNFKGEDTVPGLKEHATLVGVVKEGEPVIGVIFNHYTGELAAAVYDGDDIFESRIQMRRKDGSHYPGMTQKRSREKMDHEGRVLLFGQSFKDSEMHSDVRKKNPALNEVMIAATGPRILYMSDPSISHSLSYTRIKHSLGIWDIAAAAVFARLNGVDIFDGNGVPAVYDKYFKIPGHGGIYVKGDGLGYRDTLTKPESREDSDGKTSDKILPDHMQKRAEYPLSPEKLFHERESVHGANFRSLTGTMRGVPGLVGSENMKPGMIALGTNWLREYSDKGSYQYKALNPLISFLRNYCERHGMILVVGVDDELPGLIDAEKKNMHPEAKVVMLIGADREGSMPGYVHKLVRDDRYTIVGVDSRKMPSEQYPHVSYIRIMEILNIALMRSQGLSPHFISPEIQVFPPDSTTPIYIVVPEFKKVEFRDLKRIYEFQIYA